MPRRPAAVIPEIPLFLIATVVSREVKKAGGELVRIVIKKVKGHCYDIFVHTRSVYRVLRPQVPRADAWGLSMAVIDP
jgi:hypothetical protein